jgi:hypothetical protein
MERAQWWTQRLQGSLDNFLWAVDQIPAERQFVAPREGRWPAARILFHLGWYEHHIALPQMRQWFGEPAPPATSQEEDAATEEQDWNGGTGHTIAAMTSTLQAVRADEVALVVQAPDDLWLQERAALWGTKSLQWVVTKTFQHTLEHTDEILRQYLWHF